MGISFAMRSNSSVPSYFNSGVVGFARIRAETATFFLTFNVSLPHSLLYAYLIPFLLLSQDYLWHRLMSLHFFEVSLSLSTAINLTFSMELSHRVSHLFLLQFLHRCFFWNRYFSYIQPVGSIQNMCRGKLRHLGTSSVTSTLANHTKSKLGWSVDEQVSSLNEFTVDRYRPTGWPGWLGRSDVNQCLCRRSCAGPQTLHRLS